MSEAMKGDGPIDNKGNRVIDRDDTRSLIEKAGQRIEPPTGAVVTGADHPGGGAAVPDKVEQRGEPITTK